MFKHSCCKLLQHLTGDDSPLQDKDPYDGGKAVVATAPSSMVDQEEVMFFHDFFRSDVKLSL